MAIPALCQVQGRLGEEYLNMIKYAVLDPRNGTYTFMTDAQERDNTARQLAWELYLSHVHNVPYSVVEVMEDGSEQWTSPNQP